jgi:hypothetical protein
LLFPETHELMPLAFNGAHFAGQFVSEGFDVGLDHDLD